MTDKHKELFMQLVQGLESSAWMLMGKVQTPDGKTVKNLPEADKTIEMLMMLEFKTKGNLGEKEEQVLKATIQNLQINYVNEMRAAGKDPITQK